MDKFNDYIKKWDGFVCSPLGVQAIKILGALLTYLSTSILLDFAPFKIVMSEQIVALLPILFGVSFYLSTGFTLFLFGLLIASALSGMFSALVLMAGVCAWMACGEKVIVSCLTIITPIFMLGMIDGDGESIFVYMPVFIFVLSTLIFGKLSNSVWKFAYPIYFVLLACNFNYFGEITTNFFRKWPAEVIEVEEFDSVAYFGEFADFATSFDMFGAHLKTIVISIIIYIILACILYRLIDYKGLKFLSLPTYLKDAIIVASAICLIVVGNTIVKNACGVEPNIGVVDIILQSLFAYIISRPISSPTIIAKYSKDNNEVYAQNKNAIFSQYCCLDTKEDFLNILETYLDKSKFENILSSEKKPINTVLIYGREDLDKTFVIQNYLSKQKLEYISFDVKKEYEKYKATENSSFFESVSKQTSFGVFVLNEIDEIFESVILGDAKDYIEALAKTIENNRENPNILFVISASDASKVPEFLYEKGCINKIYHVSSNDSILLNNTYRLLKNIGQGGSGIVYKAIHERLAVTVVVKKILDKASNQNTKMTEANVLKKIKHSYLPKVYDTFVENGDLYTVVDYIPGDDLQKMISKDGLCDEITAIDWAIQLTEAVEYLHSQSPPILHSDIKPGNIMITPDGNVCLIDFNISLLFNAKDTKSIGITPGYSPIEQYGSFEQYAKTLKKMGKTVNSESSVISRNKLENNSEVIVANSSNIEESIEGTIFINEENIEEITNEDCISIDELRTYAASGITEKSDIYSIGATLYTLVSGERPSVLFEEIVSIDKLDLNISKEFAVVIKKAMNINPCDRYETITELKTELEKVKFNL